MSWKKISYFGDALSHAVLLGLALGALFGVDQILSLIVFAAIFAILVFLTMQNSHFGRDSAVMIASYFSIALAMIFNDLWIKNLDFSSYIFGDVLSSGMAEIKVLSVISLITILYVKFGLKKIMLIDLNEDLAQISGIRTKLWNLSFLILLAVVIALTTRIAGIFLTTAILVLPASIARIFAKSSVQMMVISLLIGVSNATFSFILANHYNLTVGPVIIASFCVVFFMLRASQALRR